MWTLLIIKLYISLISSPRVLAWIPNFDKAQAKCMFQTNPDLIYLVLGNLADPVTGPSQHNGTGVFLVSDPVNFHSQMVS